MSLNSVNISDEIVKNVLNQEALDSSNNINQSTNSSNDLDVNCFGVPFEEFSSPTACCIHSPAPSTSGDENISSYKINSPTLSTSEDESISPNIVNPLVEVNTKYNYVCQVDYYSRGIIKKFTDYREAGKDFPDMVRPHKNILSCLLGRRLYACGFMWVYKSDFCKIKWNEIPKPKKALPQWKREVIDGKKYCSHCGEELPEENFYKAPNGNNSNVCAICAKKYRDERGKDFNVFINHLLYSAQHSASQRKNKNRIEAGICELTLEDLFNQVEIQEHKCYYSGIPLSYIKKSHFQCSLERLNPSLGYLKNNICLSVLELNSASQWSKEKIKLIPSLVNKEIDLHKLQEDVNFARTYDNRNLKPRENKSRNKAYIVIIKNIKWLLCYKCDTMKVSYEFPVGRQTICKDCEKIKNKKYVNSLRGFVVKLLNASKGSISNNSKKAPGTSDTPLTLDFLFDLLMKQNGRCAYSNIPLIMETSANWRASLERINPLRPYCQENVCLICQEFNTFCTKNESENTGDSQWSKEKFQVLLENLIKKYNINSSSIVSSSSSISTDSSSGLSSGLSSSSSSSSTDSSSVYINPNLPYCTDCKLNLSSNSSLRRHYKSNRHIQVIESKQNQNNNSIQASM